MWDHDPSASESYPQSALVDHSKRKFVGNTLGAVSIFLLLLLALRPAAIWAVSPAVSGTMIVAFFCGALTLSIAAGFMASRWWFALSWSLFGLYVLIVLGEAFWESKATGHW
jgi:hypothetical protein